MLRDGDEEASAERSDRALYGALLTGDPDQPSFVDQHAMRSRKRSAAQLTSRDIVAVVVSARCRRVPVAGVAARAPIKQFGSTS
jgi:hypothetical protein